MDLKLPPDSLEIAFRRMECDHPHPVETTAHDHDGRRWLCPDCGTTWQRNPETTNE